ncbi:MAG: Holliday junction resolvase RuvX [Clostridiales bacterium]|nr:Holliday junction resolvase RuvX [Clostridiales bacterium]
MDNNYYKIMALDFGDVRIGVALSDMTRTIASGYENYTRCNDEDKDISHIMDIAKSNNVKLIVMGIPYNMDGTESNQTLKTKAFAEKLSAISGIEIKFQDERLTSKLAERMLINADVSRMKRKNVLDKLSATIILQDYLNQI